MSPTRFAVLKVIDQLGYRPSHLAASLSRGTARTMATVVRFPRGDEALRDASTAPSGTPRSREVMARLRSLGIPARLLTSALAADIETRGLYAALTRALGAALPVAPEVPLGAGEVLFLVGPGVETLRASIGIAVFPDDGESAPDLLHAADERLLAAKRDRNARRARRQAA